MEKENKMLIDNDYTPSPPAPAPPPFRSSAYVVSSECWHLLRNTLYSPNGHLQWTIKLLFTTETYLTGSACVIENTEPRPVWQEVIFKSRFRKQWKIARNVCLNPCYYIIRNFCRQWVWGVEKTVNAHRKLRSNRFPLGQVQTSGCRRVELKEARRDQPLVGLGACV